jgi:hypothetical protein
MVIEIEMKPENDMTVVCDCVGILKERNVDVEHRLGGKNNTTATSVTRNKKKSTKCRMIFRAKINDDMDQPEILQICSNTITCTQPPGVPEICKKSLDSCSILGGKELFIIGKNFLKDTKITFARYDESRQASKKLWEETVLPDKEYLQQTHLICTIPAYPDEITEPIQVQIYITSSNKKSESHNFLYIPLKKYNRSIPQSPSIDLNNIVFTSPQVIDSASTAVVVAPSTQTHNVITLTESSIMPPPSSSSSSSSLSSTMSRKPSFSTTLTDSGLNDTNMTLKTEYIDQQQSQCTINGDLQDTSTSVTAAVVNTSTTTLQQQPSVSVKEIMFNHDSTMIDVTNQCFINTSAAQTLSLTRQIKNEQSVVDQQQNIIASPTNAMLPPAVPPAQSDINSCSAAVQQQAVENFINMICAQVEPTIVQQTSDNIIHMNEDLMLNQSPTNVSVTNNNNNINNNINNNNSNNNINSNNAVQSEHTANLLISSAISSQTPMICEQNLIAVQIDGENMLPIDIGSSTNDTNASLISNAVSDATAETQAVVKQMIASVAAEMLSENPTETQSTINSFISSTLGGDISQTNVGEQSQQQGGQITPAQQQQLQDIIAQELMTPVMIKKEDSVL